MLDGLLPPGYLDPDAAHGLGGEEVVPAVPVPGLVPADESDVRLVDEGGRLQSLAGLLLGQAGGELAHLVVHEREQLGGCRRVPGCCRVEELRDVGHAAENTPGQTAERLENCTNPAEHSKMDFNSARVRRT
jgi:hypothetical protein